MRLVVVGYGNMAKAILQGLAKSADLGIKEILIVGRNPHKIEAWAREVFRESSLKLDFEVRMDSIGVGGAAVLLACKPPNISSFSFNGEAFIVYSLLAGVGLDVLSSCVDSKNFVLVMPNVGASLGLSSSAVFWEGDGEDGTRRVIEGFVGSFGNCIFLGSYGELLASIATNGSSPAVLALVAQALINAGVHSGLKLELSAKLVQKTFEGIAALLKEKTPQEIKDSITSPNGTTARALLHCDENGVQGHITRSLIKAVDRAKGV